MFVPIHPEALVVGTKYKIGTSTWIYVKTWDAPDGITRYEFFDMINPTFQRFRFFTSCTFYQFVPQHPQEKMERRAVNLIVRRLIGDDHFEW
jgi:hypothetical protein